MFTLSSMWEGFARGLLYFHPACPERSRWAQCLASRGFSLNSIIPTHPRCQGEGGYTGFFVRPIRRAPLHEPRSLPAFLSYACALFRFPYRTYLLSLQRFPHSFQKNRGYSCLVIPIAPERIGRAKLARLGRRPLQGSCSTSHQTPITSHSLPVAGRWSPATSSPILPTR